jgi:hypothetical protein
VAAVSRVKNLNSTGPHSANMLGSFDQENSNALTRRANGTGDPTGVCGYDNYIVVSGQRWW